MHCRRLILALACAAPCLASGTAQAQYYPYGPYYAPGYYPPPPAYYRPPPPPAYYAPPAYARPYYAPPAYSSANCGTPYEFRPCTR